MQCLIPKNMCSKRKKGIYVEAFNLITNKDEDKAMTEHISCDCKCKPNNSTRSSNQMWNNKKYQCERKNFHK